jgi:hypothetical protein
LDENFDSYISFDQDTFGGVNFYFPLLYAELLFRDPEWAKRLGVDFNLNELSQPRQITNPKTKFACAFIGNAEPIRLRAIEELREYGEVDVFGAHTGKPIDGKHEASKDYKYMLCFENDLYPGYITEKLLDAYVCETVPLYRGDFGDEAHVNRQSLLNATDFKSLKDFAHHVGTMSESAYLDLFRQPLLNTLPSIDPLVKALTGRA